MATLRAALSVEDVFLRLETVREHVTARRQIDLSKRDIEFLLDYRDRMEIFRNELKRKTNDLDSIKHILALSSECTEESLENLAIYKPPATSSDLTSNVYQNTLLLETLKLAALQSYNKAKHAAKIDIPKAHSSNPAFYSIIRINTRKNDSKFDRHLERVTKLWMWVRRHADRGEHTRKKTISSEPAAADGKRGVAAISTSVPPTPLSSTRQSALSKTPAPPKTVSTSSGNIYRCQLLLNQQAKDAALDSPEFRKMTSLEEKLGYLLSHLTKDYNGTGQALTVTQLKPAAVRKESIGLQTDFPTLSYTSSNTSKESSSQTSTNPTSRPNSSNPINSQGSVDDVFLSNSMSGNTCFANEKYNNGETTHSNNSKKQHTETQTIKSEIPNGKSPSSSITEHTFSHADANFLSNYDNNNESKYKAGGTDGNENPVHENRLNKQNHGTTAKENEEVTEPSHDKSNISLTATEVDEMVAMNDIYVGILQEKDRQQVTTRNKRRRCSAPAIQRSKDVFYEEKITLELHTLPNITMEQFSRGVSAMSSGFTPPVRKTKMMKHASTQYETKDDPETMSPERLFAATDEPDEMINPTYADFLHIHNNGPGSVIREFSEGRTLLSPDSADIIMAIVVKNLASDQWKNLFKLLMHKSEVMVVPSEIQEEISNIENQPKDEHSPAAAALKRWLQINGTFETKTLQDCLTEMKRRDIVSSIQTYMERRQSHIQINRQKAGQYL